MSDFSNMLDREIAKMGGNIKIIPGNRNGSLSPDKEWLKWLAYESDCEKQRIAYLNSKLVEQLTYEELEEVSRYRRNQNYARLLKEYEMGKCSEEEYMKVYELMCHESIEELMLMKLTTEELEYAKQEIIRLSQVSSEQLSAKIKQEQVSETYEQLSMVEAYILHFISKINYARNIADLNREIHSQTTQNENMREKSLYYASNPYRKNK